ncbi:MAG: hypothetical protein RUDDFDWM_002065 [Candidatus Fervidibacterota bacterium]
MDENIPCIIKPIDGAILNRHDGEVKGKGLLIEVNLRAPSEAKVFVNSIPAKWDGQLWRCIVALTEHRTELIACAELREKKSEHHIVVLYDRNSTPRYRMSVDDNIMFLRDIAHNSTDYRSIFDDPYMAFWREMHRRYGTKVHLNIYYQTVDGSFTLRQMPDKFKNEWRENSHWLRLTFHALQDEPARPYRNAPASEIEHDFLLVTEEIIRFAGEELLSPFTTIHWGEATREGCRALRKQGIHGLVGYFVFHNGEPAVSYYLDADHTRYMQEHDYWWDRSEDIFFVHHDIVLNAFPLDRITPELERIAENPHQSEIMELIIHEQYFREDIPHLYQPDAQQKVIAALEWVTERGYKPVLYDEGFIGAPEP